MYAVIAIASLLSVSIGCWEFVYRPSVTAVGFVWFAAALGVLQARILVWQLPHMHSARRAMLQSLGLEPLPSVDPEARFLYRVLAGVMAAVGLLGILMGLRGILKVPGVLQIGIVYSCCSVWIFAFGYLALTGRWIMGGNCRLGRDKARH